MVALTTIDNPYDPFDQWDEWLNFDLLKGYNSCALLDRFSFTSHSMTDEENDKELDRAIDEIIANDYENVFIKVTKK